MSNTLNNIPAHHALTNLVIRWVQEQSGSDYIFLLDSDALSNLRLGTRHEIAAAAVAAMEAQDVKDGFMLPSRKVATVAVDEDGTETWSYKVGWGGTTVEISAEGGCVEVVVKSFYYDDATRERVIKGSVVLFEDDRGVRAAWWTKEGDHSFARLKWLLDRVEEHFDVHHSGHVDRIRAFEPLPATNGW